ncbi:transposase [Streptomyces sp. NPDC048442]|uniref:transposase n=1 Tax=Streptomyces sp. NPDC048442 TaxID=3154823 RepID=UPI003426166D
MPGCDARPGVEVVCRDGSAAYRGAMDVGAPHALHLSDRFHLWQNLGRKVYEVVTTHRDCLPEPGEETTAPRTPGGLMKEPGDPARSGGRRPGPVGRSAGVVRESAALSVKAAITLVGSQGTRTLSLRRSWREAAAGRLPGTRRRV